MRRQAHLEPAAPADGPALLQMMEEAAASGNIGLFYTRRPDPYASFHGEGGQVSLGVIRGAAGAPDFMECCVRRPFYLNGEAETVGYLSGVRRRAGAALRGNWLRLLAEYEGGKCPSYFMSVLDGNEESLAIFGKKRPYAPALRPLCRYTTYMMSPKALHAAACKRATGQYTIKQAAREDLPALCAFLADYGRRYHFFPAVTDLEAQFAGLCLEDCLLLRDEHGIAAFGALWDQTAYKQYIVSHYKGPMRPARLGSPLLRALGWPPIPKAGTVLRLATLSLLAAKDDDPARLAALLEGLAGLAMRRGLEILVAGVPAGNWQDGFFQSVRHLQFGSAIYLAQKTPAPHQLPREGNPFHFECGLL